MPEPRKLIARAFAFIIDVTGLVVLGFIAFRFCDAATKVNVDLYPPIQASRAMARLLPAWGLIFVCWSLVPVLVWRRSIGKRVMGLVIAASDGSPSVALSTLVLRETIGKGLSLATNGFGFLEIFVTGTTLHDRLLGTQVVHRDDDVGAVSSDEPLSSSSLVEHAAVLVAGALLWWSMKTRGMVYGLFWQGALYVPHEAGHLVVGMIFPHLVAVAAGGWAQNLFPSLALIIFTIRKSAAQAAGAALWLAFALFDTAHYARDAWERAMPMPVAIGDEFTQDHLDAHDWWQLLRAFDVLRYAQLAGVLISALGWVCVAWAVVGALFSRQRSS